MNPTVPFIPDDAPFTPEQRSWLNGFLAGVYSTVEAPLAKASSPSLKIAILFATQSGTSERLAKKLVKELKQQGHAPELASLDTYTTASLAEQTHALVLASTYGEGDPPDGAQAFAESLHLLSAPRLDNSALRRLRPRRHQLRALLQVRRRPRRPLLRPRRHAPLRSRRLRRRCGRALRAMEERRASQPLRDSFPQRIRVHRAAGRRSSKAPHPHA